MITSGRINLLRSVLAVTLCTISSLFPVYVVDAAHPRRRVTIRREGAAYDREITTFTEDGRLAQVEYGLEASLRGSSIGVIQAKIPPFMRKGEGEDGQSPSERATGIIVCIENSSFGKLHRIDDHIWMLTAGLAGDARMLANQARRSCQNHRLQYGEAPTVEQAARSTAGLYHQLTRMGGCRPLGCTALLMGVDDARTARLFRTDPGGGVEECRFAAVGNSQGAITRGLMDLVAILDDDNDDDDAADKPNQAGAKKVETPEKRSLARLASTMAETFLKLLDRNGKSRQASHPQGRSTLDVWTIQPMKRHRGGMLATCYCDVRKDNVMDIVLQ